jgi:Type II secretion system (T2SS), protein M
MSVRDRLIVAGVAAVIAIGAVWLVLVSPERSKASSLSSQISTERAALATAEGALASAHAAAAGYLGDVHSIKQVLAAAPAVSDEPGLVTLFTKLAGTPVDVHEIDVGSPGVDASGLDALGLSLTFHATYQSMQNFISALDRLIATDGTSIKVGGRLVTIDSVTLSSYKNDTTTAAVTATVYSQGAAPAATGATGATGASTASVSG